MIRGCLSTDDLLLFYVCELSACLYAYVPLVCLVSKVMGTHQIPRELELQVAVSYWVGAGKEPRSSAKPARILNH